jgi:hypothetical protein
MLTSVEECVVAPIQASHGAPSTALRHAVPRGVSAAVRDALARLCAGMRWELPDLPDPWLVGLEVFWDRFQEVAERTLRDPAICWEVTKVARVRLRGHPMRLSRLIRTARERELARITGVNEDGRLSVRALVGAKQLSHQ